MKKCNKCGVLKTLDQFHKDAVNNDGLRSSCKACRSAYRRADTVRADAYRVEYNARPEVKARSAQPEYIAGMKAYHVAYRARPENMEKERARGLTAKRKAQNAASRKNNRHTANTYFRRRCDEDPAFKLAMRLRARLRHAIKNKSKRGSAIVLLGCTIRELVVRFESLFPDGMSWQNWGEWHIDHIRPLTSFDLEDPAQLAAACHYTNLQPLWASDNLRKGDRQW